MGRRALRLAAAAVLAAAVGAGYYQLALADRPTQRLDGALGVPDAWRPPSHPYDVRARPLEAASLGMRTWDGVVLAAADGRGHRLLPLARGDDQVKLSPDGRSVAWHVRASDARPGNPVLRVLRLAEGRTVDVAPPGRWPVVTSFDWSPDGAHLVATGGEVGPGAFSLRHIDPQLWRVDARTGAVTRLCTCGYAVRATAGGRLVQVASRGSGEVGTPIPPGAVRLPPAQQVETPLVSPDATAYVRIPEGTDRLEVTTADGRTRTLDATAGPGVQGAYGTYDTLTSPLPAWTADGIWAVTGNATTAEQRRLVLVDPATGATRTLTRLGATSGPVTVATALTPGVPVAVVRAGPPEPTWYTTAAAGEALNGFAGRALYLGLHLVFTPLGWLVLLLGGASLVAVYAAARLSRRAAASAAKSAATPRTGPTASPGPP
jgi:hypothetical protein